MTEIGWGWLASVEGYGRLGDNLEDYKLISFEEAMSSKYSKHMHASHGMIYSKKSGKLWDLYDIKGLVMMQVRFDGALGFPGGLVDEGESPLEGVNREMEEEIGLNLDKYRFTDSHHVRAYLHEKKNLVLHFYIMEVEEEDFCHMEQGILSAPEFGIETFGTLRVPLFTMGDGVRGLPAFLANQFAGNARTELIYGLLYTQLLTEQEMETAYKACEEFVNKQK